MPQNLDSNNSKLILIGEDDIDDQEFLQETFDSIDNSFEIVFSTHGTEMLTYLDSCGDEHLPCLILLDYNMPGLNGVEILTELKNRPRCATIPKIIWSTSNSDSYKSLCLQMGAHEYLVKPSNVNDLVETCKHMLSTCTS